jgi:hypothetical protein
MASHHRDQKERIPSLAENVLKAARNRVPHDWNRLNLTTPQLKVLPSISVDGPLPRSSLAARGHQFIEGLWTSSQDWLSELLDRVDSADLETIEQALTIMVEALSRQEQYAWTG